MLLDCDEVYMRDKCTAAAAAADTDDDDAGDDDAVTSRRISDYKHQTLPILGYLEDIGKLDIVMVVAVCQNCIALQSMIEILQCSKVSSTCYEFILSLFFLLKIWSIVQCTFYVLVERQYSTLFFRC